MPTKPITGASRGLGVAVHGDAADDSRWHEFGDSCLLLPHAPGGPS